MITDARTLFPVSLLVLKFHVQYICLCAKLTSDEVQI